MGHRNSSRSHHLISLVSLPLPLPLLPYSITLWLSPPVHAMSPPRLGPRPRCVLFAGVRLPTSPTRSAPTSPHATTTPTWWWTTLAQWPVVPSFFPKVKIHDYFHLVFLKPYHSWCPSENNNAPTSNNCDQCWELLVCWVGYSDVEAIGSALSPSPDFVARGQAASAEGEEMLQMLLSAMPMALHMLQETVEEHTDSL